MADWQVVSGGVTAPKGFIASGIATGLKSTGAKDLALILSQSEAIAAGGIYYFSGKSRLCRLLSSMSASQS